MAHKNGNTVNAQTTRLVLGLIAEKRQMIAQSRALAAAQLGQAHAVVGTLGQQLEQLDRARLEVLASHAQAA